MLSSSQKNLKLRVISHSNPFLVLICISYFLHCSIFKVHSHSRPLIGTACLSYHIIPLLSRTFFDLFSISCSLSFGTVGHSLKCFANISLKAPHVNTFLQEKPKFFSLSKCCSRSAFRTLYILVFSESLAQLSDVRQRYHPAL